MRHFNFFLLIVAIIGITVLSVEGVRLSSYKREAEYIKQFAPYRDEIKIWFDNLLFERDPPRPKADFITCDICQALYPVIVENLANGATAEEIIVGIINYCVVLGIETPDICEPTVRSYANPILHIVQNRPEMTGSDFCGIINPGCTPVHENFTNWEIIVDDQKPPVQTLPDLPAGVATSKILQFTDVHVDVNYTVGMNAGCGKALCCREEHGVPENPEDAAQPYGDYRCALPPLAFESIMEHAKTAHGDIKYIFLTGDYTHSGIWLYSQEENGRNIRYVTEKILEVFPNTPIYPLVGNHEPDVVNMYPPEELWDEFDLSWMYDTVSEPFKKWLSQEQLATFKKGGYYTIKPEAHLRLVVVNTNLCYTNNFWLAFDPVDPTGQLQWLADTMLQAEMEGDHVLILGHIPTGSGSCWPVWSEKFDKIMDRFENIIRGQFYGHQHTENFNLAFERGTERATSVSYASPSTLTDGMNSGYKVFLVDGERGAESTWEIVDHETWILNTTRSNEGNAPVFEKLLSAREDYGLNSVRGTDLYDFVLRMVNDDELFLKFQRNHNKGLTTRSVCDPANEDFQECKLGLLCDSVTSNSADSYNCERLEQLQKNKAS